MKLPKEERALLSEIIQQEFTKVLLANRAEKAKRSRTHKDKTRGFLHSLAFWRWNGGQNRKEPIPAAQAASTAE
jgi:hypothetical protein